MPTFGRTENQQYSCVHAHGWMDACVCVYCARACGCPGTRLTERQTLHRKIVDVDITTWRVGRGTWDVVCRTWCVGPGVSDVVRGTWFRGRGACLGCAAKSGGRVPLPRCRVDRAPLAAEAPTASPRITASGTRQPSQRTPPQALNPNPFPCNPTAYTRIHTLARVHPRPLLPLHPNTRSARRTKSYSCALTARLRARAVNNAGVCVCACV